MEKPLNPVEVQITDNLEQLLQVLPADIRAAIHAEMRDQDLLEIVLDLGRRPEARFATGSLDLSDRVVDHSDLDFVTSRVGEFGKDNRAGIGGTLHRISAIRNRTGRVVGLTCRVGRAVFGTIDIMHDVVETGRSILMLGRPGVGKTTKLREVARVLSVEFGKRVVIVDTSNEIAGDGDIPHPAIGRARRMQVPEPALQHAVMIEAVENHMPEVIVIDEIGTEQEAFAARTIAERGVQLVGTAHGNTLDNLLMNPTLSDLIGGIQPVTLSDEEARRRNTQKTVLERKAPPTFDVVIEMIEKEKMAIHHDVAKTVDNMLRGKPPRPEIRERSEDGDVNILQPGDEGGIFVPAAPPSMIVSSGMNRREEPRAPATPRNGQPRVSVSRHDTERIERPERSERSGRFEDGGDEAPVRSTPSTVRIFPYGVSRNRLERAIKDIRVPASITKTWQDADAVIALKAHYRREPGRLKDAIDSNKSTFVVRSNTQVQIEAVLREMFGLTSQSEEANAIQEAEEAAERVLESGEAVELLPQNAYIRRLQHQIIQSLNLESMSVGTEPYRRIRISRR